MHTAFPPRKRCRAKRQRRHVTVCSAIVRGDRFTARVVENGVTFHERGTLPEPVTTGIDGRPVAEVRYHDEQIGHSTPAAHVVLELTDGDSKHCHDAERALRAVSRKLNLTLRSVDGQPWLFVVTGEQAGRLYSGKFWRVFQTQASPSGQASHIAPAWYRK